MASSLRADILNPTTFQWMQIRREAHVTLVWGRLHNTGEWCNSAGCSMMCCDTAQAGNPSAHRSQNMISAATSVLSSSSCSRSVQTTLINAKLLFKWSRREGGQVTSFHSQNSFSIRRTRTIKRDDFCLHAVLTQPSSPEGQHEGGFKKSLRRHENLEDGWWCPMSCPGIPPKSPHAPPPPTPSGCVLSDSYMFCPCQLKCAPQLRSQ